MKKKRYELVVTLNRVEVDEQGMVITRKLINIADQIVTSAYVARHGFELLRTVLRKIYDLTTGSSE